MKTFRCFVDIKANSQGEAITKLAQGIDGNQMDLNGLFRSQENPFSQNEETTILELARVALADAEIYDDIADKLDISDKELKALQKKIENVTNR